MTNGSFELAHTVTTKDVYYFLTTNCGARQIRLSFSYELVNPGGEHLPYGQVPLPGVFVAFALAWLLVLFLWLGNALFFQFSYIPLHRFIGLAAVLKTVAVCLAALYWRHLSRDGLVSSRVSVPYSLVQVAAQVSGLGVLLLICRGYCLTTMTLERAFVRTMLFTLVGLACMVLGYTFVGHYFVFLVIATYVMVLRLAFGSLVMTVRSLELQMRVVYAGGIDATTSPIGRKLKLVQGTQILLISWVFAIVTANVIGLFFWADLSWVSSFGPELADLVFFAYIAFSFRLRDFARYEVSSPAHPCQPHSQPATAVAEDDNETALAGQRVAGYEAMLLHARNVQPFIIPLPHDPAMPLRAWQPGMALPNTPGFSVRNLAGADEQVTLVLHPASYLAGAPARSSPCSVAY